MSLQTQPDFQQPLVTDGMVLYYPYEGNGPFRLLPDQLTIATKIIPDAPADNPPVAQTQLDFHLTFVRGQFPNRPPEPHGRLAFGMQPHFALATALDVARVLHPTATVAPIHMGRGSLRLLALHTAVEIPPELLAPVAIQWAGAEVLRVQLTLSPTAATFLRDALQGELLPLSAHVELEFQGVAPRLPVQVTFDPRRVLADLDKIADSAYRLSRAAMVRYVLHFFDPPQLDLPVQITGTLAQEEQHEFAEALVDRMIARFGHFVSAPEVTEGAYVQLVPWPTEEEAEVGEALFHWDLREPTLVTRRIGLTLDPFGAAQQVVQTQGIDAIYQEQIVAALPTGFHQLYISTNFPATINDVVTTGLRIRVPPRPPYRSYEIVEEIEGLENGEEAMVLLRLFFREALGYFYSTFLVLNRANGSEIVRGEEQWHEAVTLRLTAADYPAQLATLTATDALLTLATLGGVVTWREADVQHETHFAFGDTGQVALLLPALAEDAQIALRAIQRETAATLTLDALPFQDTRIGRYSFPSYGSHAVEITCVFGAPPQIATPPATPPRPSPGCPLGAGREMVAPGNGVGEAGQGVHATVELLPEGAADVPENRTTLHFTPDQPQKRWSWFAESPFAGGYRYRVLNPKERAPGAWSAVQSPFVSLRIEIGATVMDGYLPGDLRFADLSYYPDPDDSERFYYLPGTPLPVLDPKGRPMLSLLIAGSSGFLQLDVRWQAPTETLDALRREILAHHPALNPALLRLTFAPVTVEQIALLLTTPSAPEAAGDGVETVLATSQSSGVPPYNGLFSVAVNADQQDLVIAALHQRAGFLRVRYTATRQVAVTATVRLAGDVQAAFTELTATSTVEECRAWVSAALAQDQLHQERTGSALIPETLWERTEAEAVDQAAQWLVRHLQRLPTGSPARRFTGRALQDETTLSITATLSDTLAVPLVRTVDISTWFADGSGDDHIRVVG